MKIATDPSAVDDADVHVGVAGDHVGMGGTQHGVMYEMGLPHLRCYLCHLAGRVQHLDLGLLFAAA